MKTMMKKCVFLALMAVVLIGLSSCTEVVNEPCQFNKVNVDFRVPQSAWAFDETNGWYCYYYETNKITAYIYDYGSWTMSHEYNPGTKDAFLIQLPEFRFLQDEGTGDFYTQRIDYEVGVGYVMVYVTNSDYAYEPGWKPDEMYFHMQITY